MKRILLAFALVAGTVVATAPPAHACSCAAWDAAEQLSSADGAFIGSATSASNEDWAFDVGQWVKGELGSRIEVRSDGGECDFDIGFGEEVAVYLYVADGRLQSGLCSTGSADALRVLLEPAPLSTAPALFLADGRTLAALDADGLIVSERDDTDAAGRSFPTPCGGGLVAELGADEVVISEIATWSDVERLVFRRFTKALHCEGDTVLAVAGPTGERQVWDVRTREALTGLLSSGGNTDMVGSALAYVGPQGDTPVTEGVRLLDLATGSDSLLREVSVDGRTRVRGVAISPSADRVVFPIIDGEGRGAEADIYLYDIGGTLLASRSFGPGRVTWLTDDLLLHKTGGNEATIIDAGDLSVVAELGDDNFWVTDLVDEQLIGADGGAIRVRSLESGAEQVVGSSTVGRLVRLPEAVVMETTGQASANRIDTPIPAPALANLTTVERFPPVESEPAANRAALWVGIAALAALAGAAAFAVRRRWAR